jgi:DNA-binding transcriptional LysR family regulator
MPEVGEPTLDQLRVLAVVADEGSFSAAARVLGRAQSVISYTVGQLEAQLGLALFERGGRAPVLTEAGRALVADARRVGGLVQELRARALALRQGTEAEVSLAVDVMFPVPRLVEALRAFAVAFPTVGLRLRVEALGGVAHLVLQGVCCLGVSGWAGTVSDALESRAIGTLKLVPVAGPSHPLAGMGRINGAALREHTQLVLSDGSGLTEGQDYGVFSLRTWRLGDLSAKHALLKAGLGWGNMPLHLVEEDIAGGQLVRLQVEASPEYDYPVSLITPAGAVMGPALQWLAEALAKCGKEDRKDVLF